MNDNSVGSNKSKWKSDVLRRDKSADFLTKYLNEKYSDEQDVIYKESFVLNINSGWGVGKTFFLTQWKKDLEALKHPVVYFDAWKNDFTKNPLIGFISEFTQELNEYKMKHNALKGVTNNLLQAASKLTNLVATVSVNIAAKSLGIPSEVLEGNVLSESFGKQSYSQDLILQHMDIKKAIFDFKSELRDFIENLTVNNTVQAPFYIFVDELDRCRPDYAIELLENIKHFFGVKGVYFIVATNTAELTHSIRAVYGAGFNSNMYLKRFFDQEYTLPKPNYFDFSKSILDRNRIFDDSKIFIPTLDNEHKIAIAFSVISQAFGLHLRDQEQVASRLKSILLVSNLNRVHFLFLVYLIILHLRDKDKIEELSLGIKIALVPLLEGSLNFVTVQQYREDGYYDVRISISEVLAQYIELIRMTKSAIRESYNSSNETGRAIRSELLNEFRTGHDNDKSSLVRYPELVLQAGYLS